MFWKIVLWIATYALNLLLTPKPQDAKVASLEDFEAPTAEEGRSIPVLFGTKVVKGPNVVWYGDLKPRAIKGPRRYGLFGPRATIGWKYYLGIHMAICHGVPDMLRRINIDGKAAWRGWASGGQIEIDEDNLFGGLTGNGGINGLIDLEWGEPTQDKNDYLEAKLGAGVPAFRGIAAVVLRQVYLGNSPHIAPWEFRVQRVFKTTEGEDQWYPETAGVGDLDVSDTAIYIAIDVSGSMYAEGVIEMARDSMTALLELIRDNDTSSNLDIRLAAWDDILQSSIQVRDVQDDDWDELLDWVAVDMNGGGNTDFTAGLGDIEVFFNGGAVGSGGLFGNTVDDPGAGSKRRVLIFVTDGNPNDPATATAAAALIAATGGIEVYGFNINAEETIYTELLDNTPVDNSWECYLRGMNNDGTELFTQERLNQSTVSRQETDGNYSSPLTIIASGVLIAVWRSKNVTTGFWEIFFRLMNISIILAPLENEQVVETATADQRYGSVGALTTGFVITWTDDGGLDGSGQGIYAKRFNNLGEAVGTTFLVNTVTAGTQKYSQILGLQDGGFLIVWQSFGVDDESFGIVGQRYDSSATPVGTEFLISDETLGLVQRMPALALRADGMVVVVWQTDGYYIQQVILDPTNSMAVLSTSQVSTTTHNKGTPDVAPIGTGGHVVVWSAQEQSPDNDDHGIFAQLYDDAGVKVGTEILVNTTVAGPQLWPSVAMLQGGALDGGFVVAWQSADVSGQGIFAMRFDEDGVPQGTELQINETTTSNQLYPSVVTAASMFLVLWQDPNGTPVPVIRAGDDGQMLETISNAFKTNYDMNPAHIIRECLIDRTWGLGYNESDIDEDAFIAAADTLYDERFGLTLFWQEEEELTAFMTTVLSHIDAMLYVSRQTGKFVLKLIRPDYVEEELPVLTEEDVVAWSDIKRRQPSEAVNSVTLQFHEKLKGEDATVAVHNPAMVAQAGGMNHVTRFYPGITRRDLAIRVATRDLRSLGSGLADGQIICKRGAELLNPGDPFRLVSADQGFTGEVMRVVEMNLGDGRRNGITIKFVQDVFNMVEEVLVDDTPSEWEVPTEKLPVEPRRAEEMPYHELVKELGTNEAEAMLENDEGAGLAHIAGGQPSSYILSAYVRVDQGIGYEQAGELEFSPAGYADAALLGLADETSVTLTGATNLDLITLGMIASLGDEIVRVDARSGNDLTIARGCLDTVPRTHALGTPLIVWDETHFVYQEQKTDGQQVEFRLQSATVFLGILPIVETPADVVTFDSRAIRPYPVGNLEIGGVYLAIVPVGDYEITWAHRDRVGQTDVIEHVDGDQGPEAGVDYTVNVYAIEIDGTIAGSPFHTLSVGTDTFYDYDSVGDPPPPEAEAILIEVVVVRDGYENWQSASLGAPLSNLLIAGTPVTTVNLLSSYSFTVSATGGVPGYTFSVFSGTLPTGVSLNATTGLVSGTATVLGTYPNIIIRVTDSQGRTDDLASFDVEVVDGGEPTAHIFMDFVAESYLVDGVPVDLGDLCDDAVTLVSGKGLRCWDGMGDVVPTMTALFKQTVLDLFAADLGVSIVFEIDHDGTPTDGGVVMHFYDQDGNEDDYLFYEILMEVNGDGQWISNISSSPLNRSKVFPDYNRAMLTISRLEGADYLYEFALQGGYQGSLMDGSTPMTDTVSESYYFGDEITDGYIGAADPTYFLFNTFYVRKIEVYAAMEPDDQLTVTARDMPWEVVTEAHTPFGGVGYAYPSFKITAFGGVPPYDWTVSTGTIPPGLTIDAYGNVSGTPTTPGLYTFVVTVSDSSTNSTDMDAMEILIADHYMELVGETSFSGTTQTVVTDVLLGADDANRLVVVALYWTGGFTEVRIEDGNSGDVSGSTLMEQQVIKLNQSDVRDSGLDIWTLPWPTGDDTEIFYHSPSSSSKAVRARIYTIRGPDEFRVAGVGVFNPTNQDIEDNFAIPGPDHGFLVGVGLPVDTVTGLYVDDETSVAGMTLTHARQTLGDGDSDRQLVMTSVFGSNLTRMSVIGIQRADAPYVPWYSLTRFTTARNFHVDMSSFSPVAGDQMLALVMHRSSLTQVPPGWELVSTVTCVGAAALNQTLSMYRRRARATEGWECWQQTSVLRMGLQVTVARSDAGPLDVVDSDTDNADNITSDSDIIALASITATADDQLVVSGGTSVLASAGSNLLEPEKGIWSLVPVFSATTNLTDEMRLAVGWCGLMDTEVFTGSFINNDITPTAENGIGSVTALLGPSILAIEGTPVLDCQQSTAYAGFTVTASLGAPAYVYTVQSGTLPAGISLDSSSGVVSGTPTTVGIYEDIVIRVTDDNADTADLPAFSMIVWDGALASALTDSLTTTTANATLTSRAIGVAHGARLVVVTIAWSHSSSNLTIPHVVTIGGIAAKELARAQHKESTTSINTVIAYAVVPTGTTATIVLSGTQNRTSVAVYRVINPRQLPVVDSDFLLTGGASAGSITLTAATGDVVFGVGVRASNTAWTATGGLTLDYAATAGTVHAGRHASLVVPSSGGYSFGRPATANITLCGVVIKG